LIIKKVKNIKLTAIYAIPGPILNPARTLRKLKKGKTKINAKYF